MSPKYFPFLIALGLLTGLTGCSKQEAAFEPYQPPATPSELQKYWTVPDFTLTERSGQLLHLADLAGKVWVADFFYTTCPGPCPVLTGHVGDVQKALGSAPDVRLVSISVDPTKDTPDVLQDYAARFHAGEHWFFCTGEKDAIYKLAHDGFKLPTAEATAGAPIIHTPASFLSIRLARCAASTKVAPTPECRISSAISGACSRKNNYACTSPIYPLSTPA